MSDVDDSWLEMAYEDRFTVEPDYEIDMMPHFDEGRYEQEDLDEEDEQWDDEEEDYDPDEYGGL